MPGHVDIWTVYDHPKDFPNDYVARRFQIYGNLTTVATQEIITAPTLKAVQYHLRKMGLFCLPRQEHDDPVIVETWI